MTPIRKYHTHFASTGTSLEEISALYQNILAL